MRNSTQVLPTDDNLDELCEQFPNFIGDKIQKIRSKLVEVLVSLHQYQSLSVNIS